MEGGLGVARSPAFHHRKLLRLRNSRHDLNKDEKRPILSSRSILARNYLVRERLSSAAEPGQSFPMKADLPPRVRPQRDAQTVLSLRGCPCPARPHHTRSRHVLAVQPGLQHPAHHGLQRPPCHDLRPSSDLAQE